MLGNGFDINVTSSEVLVKQDGSGGARGVGGVISILGAAYLFVFTVVIDKHGRPGLWHNFKAARMYSFTFYLFLLLLAGALGFCGYLLLIGIRLFFPGGEQLQCDRTTFTYSKIPWVSFRGRWTRRSLPVAGKKPEPKNGVIVEGNEEKNIADTYGFSFYVGDKDHKALCGPEAS